MKPKSGASISRSSGIQLIVADLDGEIDLAAASPRGLGVQGEDADPAIVEELAQSLDVLLRLVLALPPILIVHVEDEVDGGVSPR